jgi:hypothetical protein
MSLKAIVIRWRLRPAKTHDIIISALGAQDDSESTWLASRTGMSAKTSGGGWTDESERPLGRTSSFKLCMIVSFEKLRSSSRERTWRVRSSCEGRMDQPLPLTNARPPESAYLFSLMRLQNSRIESG